MAFLWRPKYFGIKKGRRKKKKKEKEKKEEKNAIDLPVDDNWI